MRVRGAAGLGTDFGCSANRGLAAAAVAVPGWSAPRRGAQPSPRGRFRGGWCSGAPGAGPHGGRIESCARSAGGPAVSVFLTSWLLLKD